MHRKWLQENKFYLNSFIFIFWNFSFPKLPNSLNGVLYTSSIATFIILGATQSISAPPDLIIWSILCWAILFISPVAWFIIFGAILPTWFTVSLPAYAKSYLFKKPPTWLFLVLFFFQSSFSNALTSLWVNNYLSILSSFSWLVVLFSCFCDIVYIYIFVWFE